MSVGHFWESIFHRMDLWAPFMDRLQALFADMDAEYERIAASCGFKCRGCEDNCCLTRFYHHTIAEYLYLWMGFQSSPQADQKAMVQAAEKVARQTALSEQQGQPIRIMCPVNQDGWCRLYFHRPMICRLHGVAHKFQRPDGGTAQGPGCDWFDRTAQHVPCEPLDRTLFYAHTARLEKNLRETLVFSGRIRMTVAEMIRSFPETSIQRT